jgi:hypothetical protein
MLLIIIVAVWINYKNYARPFGDSHLLPNPFTIIIAASVCLRCKKPRGLWLKLPWRFYVGKEVILISENLEFKVFKWFKRFLRMDKP